MCKDVYLYPNPKKRYVLEGHSDGNPKQLFTQKMNAKYSDINVILQKISIMQQYSIIIYFIDTRNKYFKTIMK